MNPSFPARPATGAGAGARAADLHTLQQDPAARRTLMAWQATAADTVTKLIDSLTQQLAGAAGPTTPTPAPEVADHYDIIRARAQAQRRQAHLEQCRQLAQDMVFAALHHLDDPQWNPLGRQEQAHGAATAVVPAPPDNLLLMLLKLELAGQ